jgi:hypothetical protein
MKFKKQKNDGKRIQKSESNNVLKLYLTIYNIIIVLYHTLIGKTGDVFGLTLGGLLYGDPFKYYGVYCIPSEVDGLSFSNVYSASSLALAFNFYI